MHVERAKGFSNPAALTLVVSVTDESIIKPLSTEPGCRSLLRVSSLEDAFSHSMAGCASHRL